MTGEQKKTIIAKIDSLTFALWGVRDAIRHTTISCETCGKCKIRKKECRVAKSYRKLTTIRQLLSEEINELENPR